MHVQYVQQGGLHFFVVMVDALVTRMFATLDRRRCCCRLTYIPCVVLRGPGSAKTSTLAVIFFPDWDTRHRVYMMCRFVLYQKGFVSCQRGGNEVEPGMGK